MLPPLNLTIAITVFVSNIVLASDLNWVHELNKQAEQIGLDGRDEAQEIIIQAQKASQKFQKCPQTNAIVKSSFKATKNALLGEGTQSQSRIYPDLLVFVSFSMPLTSLQKLGATLQKVGGRLVFRGLVEGSFKKTAIKFKELCYEALIDPTLFEKHKVASVPVFVLHSPELKSSLDKITGHISLQSALREMKNKGDLRDLAESLLTKLGENS